MDAILDHLSQPALGSVPLAFAAPFPQPLWRQYLIILTKNVLSYWRCGACSPYL